MTKKTFLKKLEAKLEGLDEKHKNKILKKYERIIDKEISTGKNEKDVVASLGDIDLIVKLNTDKDDEEPIKETNETSNTKHKTKWIDYTLKFIDDAFNGIDDQLAKRILLIICFVFVAFIFASIINIPFKIVEYIGLGIFNVIFSHYFVYETVSAIWSVGINVCYAIVIIWFIIHYVEAITNKYSAAGKRSKSESRTKEEKVINKEVRPSKNNDFLDVIFVILKVFVIILTIPFFFALFGLIIAFVFLVSLIVQGVMVFGPAILLLGLIVLFGSLLDVIYTSISRKGDK